MVTNLGCSRCGVTTVIYTSVQYGVGYVLCSGCRGNMAHGPEHIKSTFGFIEQAKFNQLEATIKRYKEFNYIYIKNGELLNPFLSEASNIYMKKHHEFLDSIKNLQPQVHSSRSQLKRHSLKLKNIF